MFEGDNYKNNKILSQQPPAAEKDFFGLKKEYIYYFLFFILIFIISTGIIFFNIYYRPDQEINTVVRTKAQKESSSTDILAGLPSEYTNSGNDDFILGTSTENLKAEDISFGYFYKKREDNFKIMKKDYVLPVNIKTDTVNYYDVSRKINLDESISDLNQDGFSVLKNKNNPESDDFFEMYRFLLGKQIPVVVTNDFILYYYNNVFKNVYKEIEKNIFFENVWDINSKLYSVTLAKYKKRLAANLSTRDPVLEADRLELAYFAVALNLLAPTPEQVNKQGIINAEKFSQEEETKFEFSVPEYLRDDVNREVELIRAGKTMSKSPVLRFSRNYSDFIVPVNYRQNAKLHNFYLTLKWFNSIFPLNYRSEICPDCLLDYNDWTINFSAACFLAKDLSSNQELKNRWAIIYKFISFFSGLRQDLTYLHYNEALSQVYGADYDPEVIFALTNLKREEDFEKIRTKLLGFKFSEMEGMLSRTDTKTKPMIGMRMLQEPYWPSDFIFENLTGENLIYNNQAADAREILTACKTKDKDQKIYRCGGFGLDIIDLIHPLDSQSQYFLANTDYTGYEERMDSMRQQTDKFDLYSWNNNIFWLNLDLSRILLSADKAKLPVFAGSDSWQSQKIYNTVLGQWVNLHLPEDNLVNYSESKGSALNFTSDCNVYNYVEPDIDLLNDLIARNEMMMKMLTMLRVAEKTNAVSIELKELNQKLEKLLGISKKELTDSALSNDDCLLIKDLVSHYKIENEGGRSYIFDFKDKKLTESIDGVKLLALVNQFGDNKVILLGPVYNYSEK